MGEVGTWQRSCEMNTTVPPTRAASLMRSISSPSPPTPHPSSHPAALTAALTAVPPTRAISLMRSISSFSLALRAASLSAALASSSALCRARISANLGPARLRAMCPR